MVHGENVLDLHGPPRQEGLPGQEQLVDVTLRPVRLTPTQERVMALLAQGLTAKEVAWRTCRSIQTIKNHATAVHQRLNVTNNVAAFKALGWLKPPETQA